ADVRGGPLSPDPPVWVCVGRVGGLWGVSGLAGSAGLAACGVPLVSLVAPEGGLDGQIVAGGGGEVPVAVSHRRLHAPRQGHRWGRCSTRRRPDEAIRAGTAVRTRWMVAILAWHDQRHAAARERLNASTAKPSHAALAENLPEGRCVS